MDAGGPETGGSGAMAAGADVAGRGAVGASEGNAGPVPVAARLLCRRSSAARTRRPRLGLQQADRRARTARTLIQRVPTSTGTRTRRIP